MKPKLNCLSTKTGEVQHRCSSFEVVHDIFMSPRLTFAARSAREQPILHLHVHRPMLNIFERVGWGGGGVGWPHPFIPKKLYLLQNKPNFD